MKPLEAMRRTGVSKYIMPLLGVLLVFSLSVHSHRISFGPDSLVKITGASHESGHSVETCSACRLQGNIKPASVRPVFSPIDPGQEVRYKENEDQTVLSFLLNNKLSRSPPAI